MSAKYTSQWTQRARINPVSSELANDIVASVKAEKITLESIGERKAISQFTILVAMWGEALEQGMDTDNSMAESILYQQANKIRNYRKNAYSLSERQVQVIWNRLSKWVKVEAKVW